MLFASQPGGRPPTLCSMPTTVRKHAKPRNLSHANTDRIQIGGETSKLIPLRHFANWSGIFLAVLLAYWPALRGGLLWDDTGHITAPRLRSLYGLWRIWFDLRSTQQYYPLLHSAFWLEHRLWGDAVLGYHLVNLAEHAVSAYLVVLIVRRLGLRCGWLAGLIFALHPVCVEAVAWISEQKSTLSALFYLASALTYLHFDRSRRRSQYLAAFGLFCLALATKTVTATLPAALLVIFWWQRGRLEWRRDVRPLLSWLALGAFAGLFTAWIERNLVGAQGADFQLSLAQRVLLAGRIVFFYAAKILWPSHLMFTYPHWQPDPRVWWQLLYPLALVVLAFVLWRLPRRGPLAALLLFCGTLFPVLGFLNVYPFHFSYVADHFQYLASLAIIVPAAYLLMTGARRISPTKAPGPALVLLIPAILGMLTWRQSHMYRDSMTLYRTTVVQNPNSWMAHNNLAATLLLQSEAMQDPAGLSEALTEFQTALRLHPKDSPAQYNVARVHVDLGNAWLQKPGGEPEAIAEYRAALLVEPEYAQAHSNLGLALAQIGRQQEAITEYETALRINPRLENTHNYLGVALAGVPGRLSDAIAEYQAAINIRPDYAEAHNNLGIALAQTPGKLPLAISEFQAALRIQPDNAETHNDLGVCLMHTRGRLAEAMKEFEAALRIQPDYAEAKKNLQEALSQIQRSPRASTQ
jgi:tetratricopeptide (TPR) repeat protein